MKNTFNALVLLILVSLGYSTEFSVQGVLRDPLGRTVDDGQYSVTFKIYDVASSGAELWTEVHGSVDIQHGIFTELLGGITSMEDLAFNTTYWIGISVEDGVEMSPRTQLTTSPYSKSVFGTDNVFPSIGRIGVGTLEPEAAFHIKNKNDETDILLIKDASNNEQVKVANDGTLTVPDGIFGNGVLGVGTQEPDARMHIVGADGDNLLITDSDGNAQVKVANDGTLTVPDGVFGNGVLGVGTQDPTAALHILSNGDDDKLRIDDENGDPQVQVNSDGYLGINNPTLDGASVIGAPLSVSGNLRLYNDGVLLFTDGTQLASADFGGSATGVTSPSTATINALSSDGNIALNVGSADKVVVTSTLTDISTSLTVSGATTVNGVLKANGAYAGFGQAYSNVALNVQNVNDHDYAFLVEDSNGNNDFYVYSNGTVSAKRDFEVDGSTTLGGTLDVTGATTVDGEVVINGPSRLNPYGSNDPGNQVGYRDVNIKLHGALDEQSIEPGATSWGYLGTTERRWYAVYGTSFYGGSYNTLSDRNLKENIRDLDSEDVLSKLMNLRGVKYDAKPGTILFNEKEPLDNENIMGVIAQEVTAQFPEVAGSNWGENKTVNYARFAPIFIESIQQVKIEKDQEIAGLKKEYDEKISALLERVEALENK